MYHTFVVYIWVLLWVLYLMYLMLWVACFIYLILGVLGIPCLPKSTCMRDVGRDAKLGDRSSAANRGSLDLYAAANHVFAW